MRKILALVLLVCCTACACAQVPSDVPADHWAYDALSQMVANGYLEGYPDGMFKGDRALTRYEFASVVKRVLDEVNHRLETVKTAPAASVTPAPVTTPANVASEVTKEDMAVVRKLVDEFKVELLVIGTRLDNLEQSLAEVQAESADQKEALEQAKNDLSKLRKMTFSGYVQSRYQTSNYDKENESNDSYDTFLVRRARIKATAKATEKTGAVLQLDLGRNEVTVKDAYILYAFAGAPDNASTVQLGQQLWWFGYEVPYSSSKRETPERALVARRFFPGERDQGLAVIGPTKDKITWIAGLYNGTGTEDGSFADQNNAKDQLLRLQYHGSGWDFGVSGYNGKGVWADFGDTATYMRTTKKARYGADAQYYSKLITFKGEYMRGKGMDNASPDFDQNQWLDGYYLQLNYNLNQKNLLVGRFSTLSQDPANPVYGRRSAWEFGAIHSLDANNRLKLFYKLNEEQNDPNNELGDNNVLAAEWIITY